VKLKELPYLLGLQPAPKIYGYELRRFELAREGTVEYAQWLHPNETPKAVTQQSVDEVREFLSAGDVAIDIGAHTGDSTIPMALAVGPEGCVLALEPNRFVFTVLEKNAGLNGGKTRIIPLMLAATPEDAEMEFQYSDSGFCNGGRFEGMSKWAHGHAFKLKVQGRNLVALMKASYPQLLSGVRYIKVDTEGYEATVLHSLAELISSNRPFLKVEFYSRLDEAKRVELYRCIADFGYRIHKVPDQGSYFGEIVNQEDVMRWRHYDVFCVPQP